jgi:hypothetical protein
MLVLATGFILAGKCAVVRPTFPGVIALKAIPDPALNANHNAR